MFFLERNLRTLNEIYQLLMWKLPHRTKTQSISYRGIFAQKHLTVQNVTQKSAFSQHKNDNPRFHFQSNSPKSPWPKSPPPPPNFIFLKPKFHPVSNSEKALTPPCHKYTRVPPPTPPPWSCNRQHLLQQQMGGWCDKWCFFLQLCLTHKVTSCCGCEAHWDVWPNPS